MRALLLLAALTACEAQEPPASAALDIACVPDGGDPARCGVTRATAGDYAVLTVTEPDGGFRRLVVAADGAITAADGAAAPRVSSASGGTVEVTLDDDRYSLPAR